MDHDVRGRQPRERLEDVLQRRGAVTPEQLKRAHEEQKKWGGELGRVLVDLEIVSEDGLMDAVAEWLGVGRSRPDQEALDPQIVSLLGVQACERFGVIAVGGDPAKRILRVATSDPLRLKELKEVVGTKFRLEPVTATQDSIQRAIRKYYYGETQGSAPTAPAGPHAVHGPGTATPPSAAAAGASRLEQGLSALEQRLLRLERGLAVLKELGPDLTSHPQVAALTARVELLEQLASNEAATLKVMAELLVEKGLSTREEIIARVRGKRAL